MKRRTISLGFVVICAMLLGCKNAVQGSLAYLQLTITSPVSGTTVTTKTVTVTGTAPAGAIVTQDISLAPDQHVTASGTGGWQMPVELEDGANTLTFRLGDDATTDVKLELTYSEVCGSRPLAQRGVGH